MTTKRPAVPPLIDIQSEAFAKQYQLGVWWSMHGDEQGKGPVSASYLVTNLKSYTERGCFNSHNDSWLARIGFFLGMYHGGILLPSTGQLRPDIATFGNLDHNEAGRGYEAGREWYFVEAEPHERRLTESQVIQRLREDATEMTEHKNDAGTWFFCIGCLLGELSGQLFPVTAAEEQLWLQERRCCEAIIAEQIQEQQRHTVPLPVVKALQEA